VRLLISAAAICALALAAAASAATFRSTLSAPGHTPRVNAKWVYTVRAADAGGQPLRARLTTQIVDPFGGVHAVEFGDTTRKVVDYAFTGVFRDFIRFPAESKGLRLTVRLVVKANGARRVLTYWIKAR
jgi:hypothetical protein